MANRALTAGSDGQHSCSYYVAKGSHVATSNSNRVGNCNPTKCLKEELEIFGKQQKANMLPAGVVLGMGSVHVHHTLKTVPGIQ